MARKIQFKRGYEKDLPKLDVAEFGFTTDTERLYVGGTAANVELAKKADLDAVSSDVEAVEVRLDDYTADVDGGMFGDNSTEPKIDGGVF